MSHRCYRYLALLAFLSPFMRAQTTLPLTPVEPWVVKNDSQSTIDPTVATKPGSVTFTVGSATYTLSLTGPASATGSEVGGYFRLTNPVNFTFSHTMTGFYAVESRFEDGGCDLFTGPGFVNASPDTLTCSVGQIYEVFIHGTESQSGVEIVASVMLETSTNGSAQFDVHFQWATSSTCPASSSAAPARSGRTAPRDSGCSDSIQFVDGAVFPMPGELIIPTGDEKTIPFFALAKFSLNSKPAGKVVLKVYDQSGKLLSTGPPVLATQGTQTAGGICTGANKSGNCLYVPAFTYNSGATTALSLVAVLQDSTDKDLAQSNAVTYPVGLPKITLTLGSQPINGSFTPAPPDTLIEGGNLLDYSVDSTAIQASYDYPGVSAYLSVLIQTDKAAIGKTLPEKIAKGAGMATFQVGSMKVPGKGTTVVVAAILETSTGQKYQTPPITVPMETIYRGPATPPENTVVEVMRDPSDPNKSLPLNFSFPVTYQIGPAGAILTETFYPQTYVLVQPPPTNIRKLPLSSGPGQTTVSFTTVPIAVKELFEYGPTVEGGINSVQINADLIRPDGKCPCAHAAPVRYSGYKLVATLPPAPPAPADPVPVAGASVTPTQNTTPRNVTTSTDNTDPNADISEFRTRLTTPHYMARAAATSTIPDFIAVQRTWQFTPPIPGDGSFAANLTLNYSPADLPDDPNFDESKLQIVSYNSTTGAFATYPTSLDTANKTATAQVTSLEPLYALVVAGPFSKTTLNAPLYAATNGFDTRASLVNTGAADAHLNVSGYSPDGATLGSSPVAKTVAAHKQLLTSVSSLGFSITGASGNGWAQAATDGNTVSGVLTIGNGSQFDALPFVAGHASSSLLTDIEWDDTYSTELRVVNPTTNARNLTIELRGPDGTSAGAYTDTLEPKSSLVNRVEDLFPSIQKPFSGYALVSSDGDVLATALLFSYSTITAVGGHALSSQNAGATTLYGAQLGASGQFTRVILVNPGTSDANLIVAAFQANGSVLGSPVAMKLGARKQIASDLSTLFNFDPNSPPAGWFKITSDQPVVGDLTFGDASFFQKTRASIALADTPSKNSVVAFAENDSTAGTTIAIANPNSTAVAVSVTAFNSDGTQAASANVNVPGNGYASSAIGAANLTGGYVTLASPQPMVAFATVAPLSGGDFAAIAAQPAAAAPVMPGGGSAPQISGAANAASFVSKLARGSLASLFGSNFMSGTPVSAGALPLPLSLAGVSVTVGGFRAPLIYVSSGQINFQVPYEVPTGTASVLVTSNGMSSLAFNVTIADYAVGVFTYARTAQALDPIIVHNATNALVTPSNPAAPSEYVVIYATGIGKLNNAPPTGVGASGPANAVDAASITVGGAAANVLYSGLTPGFPGLVQFNVQLPASLPSGNLPVMITFPGDSSAPVNLAVQGAGTASPKLSLSTSSLAFGNVTLGQTKDLSLVVSNSGNAALVVSSAIVSGPGFSLTTPSSFTVQAGGSQTVTVRFTPAAATNGNGTLSINSNDPSSPAVVSLSGTGVAATPSISVTPTSIDFGSISIGQSSQAKPITVTNTGAASATVTISATGPFSVSPTSLTIPPNGGSAMASVTFTPTATGAAGGSINVIISGQTTPAASVTLSGAGAAVSSGSGTIVYLKMESGTYNPTAGTFSNPAATTWDTDNNTKNWVIGVSIPGETNPLLNSPGKAVNIAPGSYYTYYTPYTWAQDVRLTVGWSNGATDVGYFHVAGFNNNTVWPHVAGATNLSVTFKQIPGGVFKVFQSTPQPGGAANDVLLLSITGGGSPGGQTPAISVMPSSLDFGSVNIGQSSTAKIITVTNSGTASASVNLVTSAPFSVSPASLTLPGNGGSGTASVTFKPTSVGASGSAVYIELSGQTTPAATVAVAGTGTAASTSMDVLLKIDGGEFDAEVGFPNGAANAYFVNRLTPPSYPATIKSVQILFSTRPDGLPLNAPITIVSAPNASGSSMLSLTGASFDQAQGTVSKLDAFIEYPVAARTITSGDFVVGLLRRMLPESFRPTRIS